MTRLGNIRLLFVILNPSSFRGPLNSSKLIPSGAAHGAAADQQESGQSNVYLASSRPNSRRADLGIWQLASLPSCSRMTFEETTEAACQRHLPFEM